MVDSVATRGMQPPAGQVSNLERPESDAQEPSILAEEIRERLLVRLTRVAL